MEKSLFFLTSSPVGQLRLQALQVGVLAVSGGAMATLVSRLNTHTVSVRVATITSQGCEAQKLPCTLNTLDTMLHQPEVSSNELPPPEIRSKIVSIKNKSRTLRNRRRVLISVRGEGKDEKERELI